MRAGGSWANDIQQWLANSDEKTIADILRTSPKKVDKKKIRLFALGRFNGGFPAISIPAGNVAFGQWYQVLFLSMHNEELKWTAGELFDALCGSKVDNKSLIERPVIYRMGGKEIKIYG